MSPDLNGDTLVFSVSDFVAVLNQTLEFAYPNVSIVGELANFRVSKNRWVYFDLKDETASVKFFGTVYMLPGPLEDGMLLQVKGAPRLHPQFGFSINVLTMQPVGEGSIKRAAALLEAKLQKEGLFDPARKRPLPYPPVRIGLITSGQSAAYADFIKILNERWGGVGIELADVQVQGEVAPMQIVRAIEYFNEQAATPEVLVITRGGGSSEDLAAFNTEQVTRAVAASRVPTLVAIGHEVDTSLAEMAADRRASTPSNAAQLLVPDKREEKVRLRSAHAQLGQLLSAMVANWQADIKLKATQFAQSVTMLLKQAGHELRSRKDLLAALSPDAALKRGYAIIRSGGKLVRSGGQVAVGATLEAELVDAQITAKVQRVRLK
jgi:exodeoxyribonuclease VII large subunit